MATVVLIALVLELASHTAHTATVVILALALTSGAMGLSSVPLTGLCGVTLVGLFSPWWRQTLKHHRNQAGDQQHQHSSRAAASTPSAT